MLLLLTMLDHCWHRVIILKEAPSQGGKRVGKASQAFHAAKELSQRTEGAQ